MQSIILLLFVTVVVSCSVVPNGSTPMSLSAKVVKEEHRCLSSAGPEIIKTEISNSSVRKTSHIGEI